MRYTAFLLFITLFSLSLSAQIPETINSENTDSEPKTEIKKEKTSGDEKTELEKAIALPNAMERIAALQKFIADYPQSAEKVRALELIVSARAEIAAEKLRLSETAEGVELFKLAVKEAPTPVSDKLFTGVLMQIPTNVFLLGERVAAFDIAELTEEKIGDNPQQIIALAAFYLGIEYSPGARRLAEKAIALDPESAPAHQTMGLAYRIGFNLPKAAEYYAKALELDPDSVVSKRSLAEMKRALGKTDEAATLYREILEKNESDASAKTGLILSLFDSGRQAEAEDLMQQEIASNPKNVPLMVGAAYWYATQNMGEKAVELANKALEVEPRYTWGYIALARGLMKMNDPLAAETALLNARRFGNFPTLSYELALAQAAAGFYKEAVEELKKDFRIENGKVVANLGGRVEAEGDNFVELLSLERKAGIFEPNAANDLETAEKLKALLEFENKLNTATIYEYELAEAADKFARGDDPMKTHRHLYAASRLLEEKKALPKALELAQSAVGGVESALAVPHPTSAVFADELYETRVLAKTRGQNVVVPAVPAPALSKIIRGRIEETAGWSLYEQGKYEESLSKLNLAMSILPKDSAWWRSVLWRRGMVFEKMEKPKEALDTYIKSYASEIANSEPSSVKKVIVENLYRQLNGTLDGLEDKLKTTPKTDTTAVFAKKSAENEKTENRQKPMQNIPEIVPISKTANETPAKNVENKTVSNKSEPDETNSIPPDPILTSTEISDETKTGNAPENASEKIDSNNEIQSSPVSTTEAETKSDKIAARNEITPSPAAKELKDVKKPEGNKGNPLFNPIIIDVPKTDIEKYRKAVENSKNKSTENPPETDSTETAQTIPDKAVENSESGKTEAEKISDKKLERSVQQSIDLGATRPRIVVVVEDKLAETVEAAECEITVSQEVVSIINDGGNLGVLVGLKDRNDSKNIKASSSSPKDIEVIYEPEIGGVAGQAFFLIKSISPKIGAYTVTFTTSCGKKDVLVKVR